MTTAVSTRLAHSVLASPSGVLFLALFASQSGVLVLSPILSDVADEFDVSIAQAGQLRILAAPLAAVAAIAAGRALGRFSPRALIGVGAGLVAVGSVASAVSPSFAVLALAQVPMWIGIAMLIAAGVAATAAWSAPEERTKVVSHALAGAPAAWIVGMPLIGLVSATDWRLAFLVLPLPAALLAAVAVAARPADRPLDAAAGSLTALLRRTGPRRWALGEVCANAAWAGTLVYSGALFREVYGASPAATGVLLALVAAAYLVGNRWAGRSSPAAARRAMLVASVGAAIAVALTWAFTANIVLTVAFFAAASAITAARMVAGTVFGFSVAGGHGREVGTIRAASTQIGYLVGSLAGGVAIAIGGFGLLSVASGGLFLAATLPYVCLRKPCRFQPAVGAAA